jgi:hypothetical protein
MFDEAHTMHGVKVGTNSSNVGRYTGAVSGLRLWCPASKLTLNVIERRVGGRICGRVRRPGLSSSLGGLDRPRI